MMIRFLLPLKERRRYTAFYSLVLLCGFALAMSLDGCTKKQAAAPPVPPAPEVLVTEVRQQDVPIYNEYVGSLEGSVNANIQARVSGYLVSQNYKEGAVVKKGDLLFQIDPRPFEAALAKARAALAESEASQRRLGLTAQRNVELFKRDVISAQERDNAVQANLAAKAEVEAQQALIKQAELDLEFTKITAPINGIAGIAKAQVGDLVGPSTGVLTTVSTVDPIRAYFSVSEQRYVEYTKRYIDPKVRAQHEKQLQFELILADGSVYPQKGEFFATERSIDPRTGAYRVAAIFPNPTNFLRPGQFARIRVQSDLRKGVVLVPQRAVTELQGIYQVAVVGPDNKASIRPVKVGERIDTSWIVEQGMRSGERVVVEGVQKVREGMLVVAKPWVPAPGAGDAKQVPAEGASTPASAANR